MDTASKINDLQQLPQDEVRVRPPRGSLLSLSTANEQLSVVRKKGAASEAFATTIMLETAASPASTALGMTYGRRG
jgi:hypothetical protein